MCNVYATSTTGGSANYGCLNGYRQRMCRDCCGNIWVRMSTTQCRYNSCCQCSSCYNTESGQSNNEVTNNDYDCITLCGTTAYGATQATNVNSATYPMRCRGWSGCGYQRCGGWPYGCN